MSAWLTSITSYFTAPGSQSGSEEREIEEMKETPIESKNGTKTSSKSPEKQFDAQPLPQQTSSSTSILQSIYTMTGAIGPECKIVLDHQSDYFKEEDDVRGVVIITLPNESFQVQHDGIKISLIGFIENTNKRNLIWTGGSQHMFLQISRELEFQGEFNGTLQRDFQFNKVLFNQDTYKGIGISLRYQLKVEMTYQSTLRKCQLVEEKELIVRNDSKLLVNNPTPDSIDLLRPRFIPSIKFSMKPFHHDDIPLSIKFTIKKCRVDITKENIEGYLKLKDINGRTQQVVQGFFIDLIQQEIQGSTKNQKDIDIDLNETKTNVPYQTRTLIRYEIADGCPLNDDKIPFTIPLQSTNALIHGDAEITPTLKNVYNKYSVRYFIRLGIQEQISEDDIIKDNEVQSKPYEIIFYK